MIHGIPVVLWVEAPHREAAVVSVDNELKAVVDGAILGMSLPNDDENTEWHLRWERGLAPEVVSEEFEFDRETGEMRKLDNG